MTYHSWDAEYALTDSLATTPEILYGDAEHAMVFVPAGSSITTLTFHVAPKPGGTYLAAYSAGTAVTLTVVAGRAYTLPATIKGCRAVKLVANAAGTVELSFQG